MTTTRAQFALMSAAAAAVHCCYSVLNAVVALEQIGLKWTSKKMVKKSLAVWLEYLKE